MLIFKFLFCLACRIWYKFSKGSIFSFHAQLAFTFGCASPGTRRSCVRHAYFMRHNTCVSLRISVRTSMRHSAYILSAYPNAPQCLHPQCVPQCATVLTSSVRTSMRHSAYILSAYLNAPQCLYPQCVPQCATVLISSVRTPMRHSAYIISAYLNASQHLYIIAYLSLHLSAHIKAYSSAVPYTSAQPSW